MIQARVSTALYRPADAQAAVAGVGPGVSLAVPAALGNRLGTAMVAETRARFLTATAPDGSRWQPLARPRPDGGSRPLLDTGVLRASITYRAEPDAVVVGSNSPYAGLHQSGGTVRPRSGKYLAIPLTREAKRAGSPRRMSGLQFRPSKGGRAGVLVGVGGVAQYALVKSVTVPARPFVGVSAELAETLAGVAADYYGDLYGAEVASAGFDP